MASVLSEEQQKVKSLVFEGFSVFITGKAGTGKSYFLRNVLEEIQNVFERAFLTAPTEIAPAIGGTTINSFAAIGMGSKSAHKLVARIKNDASALERWRSSKLLVIDEVSMLSRERFEKLEFIARAIKENDALWVSCSHIIAIFCL